MVITRPLFRRVQIAYLRFLSFLVVLNVNHVFFLFSMFTIFRRALDAKMNLDATRAGVTLKKQERREGASHKKRRTKVL